MSLASANFRGYSTAGKSNAVSSVVPTKVCHIQSAVGSFGVESLPSDNINAIMTNQFQRDFVLRKAQKDEWMAMMKVEMTKKKNTKNNVSTRSNDLLAAHQNALADLLAKETGHEKKPRREKDLSAR